MIQRNRANGGAPTNCPVALCESLHGPNVPGTVQVHSRTIHETPGGTIWSVARSTLADGQLSPPVIHAYTPAEAKVSTFTADELRAIAAAASTTADPIGRSFGQILADAIDAADATWIPRVPSSADRAMETIAC